MRFNKGWQLASGDLVAWLNSDDFLACGTLQRVAGIYRQDRNSQVGLIYGRAAAINRKENCLLLLVNHLNLNFA